MHRAMQLTLIALGIKSEVVVYCTGLFFRHCRRFLLLSYCYRLGNGTRVTDEKSLWYTIYQTIKYCIYRGRGGGCRSRLFSLAASARVIIENSRNIVGIIGRCSVLLYMGRCLMCLCRFGASNDMTPHTIDLHTHIMYWMLHIEGGWTRQSNGGLLHTHIWYIRYVWCMYCVCACVYLSELWMPTELICCASRHILDERWIPSILNNLRGMPVLAISIHTSTHATHERFRHVNVCV